jgi:quercetin dioxygenase-like cupin family protein
MFTVELPRDAGVPAHAHERTTEGLYVLEGGVRLALDGAEYALRPGDYASIPAGTAHRWQGDAFFTKVVSMSTPSGLEALLDRAGQATELHTFSDGPVLSAEALADAAGGVDLQTADA